MSRSSLRKAEIGLHAVEQGGLATVQYYATKLPFPLASNELGILSSAHL